jgi:hypothetical protein
MQEIYTRKGLIIPDLLFRFSSVARELVKKYIYIGNNIVKLAIAIIGLQMVKL